MMHDHLHNFVFTWFAKSIYMRWSNLGLAPDNLSLTLLPVACSSFLILPYRLFEHSKPHSYDHVRIRYAAIEPFRGEVKLQCQIII
jgi:hypothetical protein